MVSNFKGIAHTWGQTHKMLKYNFLTFTKHESRPWLYLIIWWFCLSFRRVPHQQDKKLSREPIVHFDLSLIFASLCSTTEWKNTKLTERVPCHPLHCPPFLQDKCSGFLELRDIHYKHNFIVHINNKKTSSLSLNRQS